MKKFAFTLLLMLFVLVLPEHGQAAAANNKIFLDGKELTAGQSAPVENVGGSVMVPLRMISENLGYKVDWDQPSKTVTIAQQLTTVKLVVDQTAASVDDKTVILTNAPINRNGTTLVPIRFISEQFGLTVSWDNTQKIVTLITPETGGSNTGSGSGSADGGSTVVVPPAEPAKDLTMVNGISFNENRLTIAMEGNAVPKVSKVSGPDRIVIDLENATFSDLFGSGQVLDPNLNGSLAVTGYPDVTAVRYSLYSTSPYTVRFVIDTTSSKNYSVEVSGDTSRLVVVDLNAVTTDNPSTQPGNNGRKLVVLDAGHGAKDSGAVGVTGKYEKNFNLAIVLKTAELLKKENNVDVVLTRSDDTFLELKDRAAIANNLNADLFISVHANSSSSSAASGTETYYQRESSKALANVMQKYLVQSTGLSNRGVRYGNFHVIRETKMPAVLLEAGYLSNKGDESVLFKDDVQNKIAEGIVSGIKEYLGLK
ncbi:N-acetylmuramoyl-L-alanine amidase [Paenibacillus sp. FSL R7-0273]|uniref:N-acetylmuramoyl-L-alanine amidase family protein n=1 Tax=Paenibacillus sp. FSL R7-0273 TaxID=1536772 RepID=UPI0004F6CA3E|nr:N-acetylmuramoyl-L-alanine amidase family protein [Paenibacillus sp. FSL R7-0273]AIQ48119.1 N-acetylmuramoyl-L-alanine amidase [Paenibacillus sp. FSL R7-0273]OMF91881.1 N-acetylmuramoyl-L-alanine amidase [Paenibacillus sp. FSL R7-0273]